MPIIDHMGFKRGDFFGIELLDDNRVLLTRLDPEKGATLAMIEEEGEQNVIGNIDL